MLCGFPPCCILPRFGDAAAGEEHSQQKFVLQNEANDRPNSEGHDRSVADRRRRRRRKLSRGGGGGDGGGGKNMQSRGSRVSKTLTPPTAAPIFALL